MSAVTVTYSQADVDTLRAAIASGALKVEYSGPPARAVTYNSVGEMKKILAQMVAEMNNAAGTRRRFRYMTTAKGT